MANNDHVDVGLLFTMFNTTISYMLIEMLAFAGLLMDVGRWDRKGKKDVSVPHGGGMFRLSSGCVCGEGVGMSDLRNCQYTMDSSKDDDDTDCSGISALREGMKRTKF